MLVNPKPKGIATHFKVVVSDQHTEGSRHMKEGEHSHDRLQVVIIIFDHHKLQAIIIIVSIITGTTCSVAQYVVRIIATVSLSNHPVHL